MADRIGQQLGQYRLTRLIGKGGFAEVYLGEHVRMLTQFAVKVLHAQLSSQEEARFQEEARIVASLNHPHIIHLHDYAVHDGTPYLVMDYAPTGTLRTQFPRGTAQPPGAILPYVAQVADALHFAHGQRLIHRDVKPENMLLDANNQVLLSDFGIAVILQSSSYKAAQEVLGTTAYIAPEQMQGRASSASDQYSLAVLIYEWLSGAPPFQGSMTEVMAKHLFTEPPRLRERVRTISPAIEAVVMGALSKDPEDRFPSVASFASAFEDACQAVPVLLFMAPSLVDAPEALEQSVTPPAPEALAAPAAPEPARPASSALQALQALTELGHTPPAIQALQALVEPPPPPSPPAQRTTVRPRPAAPKITDPFPREPEAPEIVDAPPMWPPAPETPEPSPMRYAVPPMPEPPAPPVQSSRNAPKTSGFLLDTQPSMPIVLSAPPAERGAGARPEPPAAALPPAFSAPPAPNVPPAFSTRGAPPVVESQPSFAKRVLGPTWREVNWIPASAPPSAAPGSPPPGPPSRGISRRTVLLGGMVGLIAVGGTLTWLGVSKLTGQAAHPSSTTPTSSKTRTPTATPVRPGATLYTYTGHSAYLRCVSWSPDGKRIASASDDHTVQIWDALTGAHPVTYTGHAAEVLAVAWSPDGSMLASGSRDDTLRIWNPATQQKIHTFTFGGRVIAVAWSHDGKYLAAGSWDGSIQVWSTSDWKQIQKIDASAEINMLSWSPDNIHVAAANDASQVVIWNATSGNKTYTYNGHNTTVLSVAWSPDGKLIASGDKLPGKTVQCWDSTSGKPLWSAIVAGQTPSLAWSPSGSSLAAGGDNASLLNPQTGTHLTTHEGDTWALAWSPDGKYLASGGQATTVQVWQAS